LIAKDGGTRVEVRSVFYNRRHWDTALANYGVEAWEGAMRNMDAALTG
jgi:hypothetical protein